MKLYAYLVGLCVGAMTLNAHATTPNTTLSDTEYRESICTIASRGALISAVARQKNLPINEAKEALNAELDVLNQSFSSPVFLQKIAEVWHDDLARIYNMEVLSSNEDKALFVSMVEEMTFSACMDKPANIAL